MDVFIAFVAVVWSTVFILTTADKRGALFF